MKGFDGKIWSMGYWWTSLALPCFTALWIKMTKPTNRIFPNSVRWDAVLNKEFEKPKKKLQSASENVQEIIWLKQLGWHRVRLQKSDITQNRWSLAHLSSWTVWGGNRHPGPTTRWLGLPSLPLKTIENPPRNSWSTSHRFHRSANCRLRSHAAVFGRRIELSWKGIRMRLPKNIKSHGIANNVHWSINFMAIWSSRMDPARLSTEHGPILLQWERCNPGCHKPTMTVDCLYRP